MKKLVIDVSQHNGTIDWKKVAASGVYGAMVRAGWAGYEGELHVDKKAVENITEAHKNGLQVGLYVYSYNNSVKSAKRTANEISAFAESYRDMITLPIAFDIEETGHGLFVNNSKDVNAQICLSFLINIEKLGFKPMLYSYTSFIYSYINMDLLNDYPLWIADYRDETGTNCPYKGKFVMWQYIGQNGRTDGVIGGCDRSWLYTNFVSKNTESEKSKADSESEKTITSLIEEITKILDKYK